MTAPVPAVLLVDDDEAIRYLLTLTLERAGYAVVQAEHGQAALERLKEARVDAIVLDIMMPVMDGLRFLEHLQDSDRDRHPPILVLTAGINSGTNYLDDDRSMLLNAGATDVARKPIAGDELVRRLQELVAAGR